MIENYNGGYKKALLDVEVFIRDCECISHECKSKAQYKEMLLSFLNLLLTNPEELERFKSGLWKFRMNPKTKHLLPYERKEEE